MVIHFNNIYFYYFSIHCWASIAGLRFTCITVLFFFLKKTNFLTSILVGSFQIVGSFWYLLSVERYDTCWERACRHNSTCQPDFLYCGNQGMTGYIAWSNISESVLNGACPRSGDNPPFDFGIFEQALSSGIVFSMKFVTKYCYCLWWGLQNLR